MKSRVHTSRQDRELTVDGLDKHHHEGITLKLRAYASTVKTAAKALTAKHLPGKRARM